MYYLKNLFIVALTFLLLATCSNNKSENKLTRSTPETEGVSSEGILRFVEAAEKSNIEFHSFMFLRHGKVIAEGWWNPYRPDLKHTMYSLSKSFTSTAVGFAVTEKRLSVNDKVISFFPEDLPDTITPYLSELKVKDLLSMSVGQKTDPTSIIARTDSNWVKTFLSIPIVNEPGSKFLYNSSATFILSAIVQKVTGEKIVDYLKPRLFEFLGIDGIDWEINPDGINTGGWGLRLKTEDIAKTGQFYLQKGSWKEKQLLPEEWIEEATTVKIYQAPDLAQAAKDSSDWLQGYCYQFWRCRNNAYRGDGAYGQFMIVMPEQDAVLAITTETSETQKELNLVWKYLLPAIKKGKLPDDNEGLVKLRKKLSSLSLPLYKKNTISPIIKNISGKTFVLEPNERNMESISFNFIDNMCQVTLKINSKDYFLKFDGHSWNFGETFLPGPNLVPNKNMSGLLPAKVTGNYCWKDNDTLELKLQYIESPHSERIICNFDQNKVYIEMTNIINRNRNNPIIKGELVK